MSNLEGSMTDYRGPCTCYFCVKQMILISTEATYQDCVYSRLADDCYWKCRMHERWIGTTSLLLACRRLHNRWNASNWKNFDAREEFHQSSPNASDLIPWGWRNETILKRTFNHRSMLCPFGSVLRKFATWSHRCNFAKYYLRTYS